MLTLYWHHLQSLAEPKHDCAKPAPAYEEQLIYVQQGQDAMKKALNMLEDREGWKVEIKEVTHLYLSSFVLLKFYFQSEIDTKWQLSPHFMMFVTPLQNNGDVICSKVIPGAGKIFRLEAVLEASVDELYDLLFVRVEEMHQWNPSIQKIKVSFWPVTN